MAKRRLTRGDRNIKWIEDHCIIPEGKFAGQKVKLTRHQRRWIRQIYNSPTRLFILSMARKNAKTALSAFLLLLHTCGPEARINSQLYSAAQSKDQAAITFNLAAKSVRMSPILHEHLTVRDTVKEIYCPELGTLYKALSAEATTAFGLSPAFLVHDELGQVRGPKYDLYEALETASAAQEDPLSIIISTQAASDGDLLSMLIDDALSEADPRNKVVLYSAPEGDDPFLVSTIRKANPHFDDFMNQVEVKRMASDAKRLPSREPEFRNLILNQRVESYAPLIPKSVWEANGAEPEPLEGKRVWAGLDLSETADLTALVLLSEDGDIHPTFWLPKEGIVEKSRADRTPYDRWASEGHLKLAPGRSISYDHVAGELRDIFDRYDIVKLGFDRYNMRHLVPWLEKAGFTEEELSRFVEFGQGYVSMSPAIRDMESGLLDGKYRHGMHPVLTMCAANAVTVMDPAGNRKFTKAKSKKRIDGMIALVEAIGVRVEKPEEGCIYNERGIRFLS